MLYFSLESGYLSQNAEAFPHSETDTVLKDQMMKSSLQIKRGSCIRKVVTTPVIRMEPEAVGAGAAFLES